MTCVFWSHFETEQKAMRQDFYYLFIYFTFVLHVEIRKTNVQLVHTERCTVA